MAEGRMDEIADGLALWQEHRPRAIEDWQGIARRFSEEADRYREALGRISQMPDLAASLAAREALGA